MEGITPSAGTKGALNDPWYSCCGVRLFCGGVRYEELCKGPVWTKSCCCDVDGLLRFSKAQGAAESAEPCRVPEKRMMPATPPR